MKKRLCDASFSRVACCGLLRARGAGGERRQGRFAGGCCHGAPEAWTVSLQARRMRRGPGKTRLGRRRQGGGSESVADLTPPHRGLRTTCHERITFGVGLGGELSGPVSGFQVNDRNADETALRSFPLNQRVRPETDLRASCGIQGGERQESGGLQPNPSGVWAGLDRARRPGREPPQARIRMARQKPELRHLIEQPILGICSSGPRPVSATSFIASNKSRRASGAAACLRLASKRPRYCN